MKFPGWLKIAGDRSYRGPCPTENNEHITFVNQCRIRWPDVGKRLIHPRNEGKRTYRQAQVEKIDGLNKGAADFVIPGRPCLVIELKRRDHTKSRWQPGQLDYLEACHAAGCVVCVALGHAAALEWLSSKCST